MLFRSVSQSRYDFDNVVGEADELAGVHRQIALDAETATTPLEPQFEIATPP